MGEEGYNPARPLVMYIDLNSCFASVEQQARPGLRGRPIGIVNRNTEHTAIVTVSYEAKARGVKVGMRLAEARRLCPDIIGIESDPPKYRYVYHRLMDIMSRYSPKFVMKSIDEGVIDFAASTEDIRRRDLVEVGYEIKHRLREEVGCAMRCNIGIAPNRFLAKTAAGLRKPDGMDVITAGNLREMFAKLHLTDLTGIAWRNEQRLNAVGIYTPLQFLDADILTLEKIVFKSICGKQWYQRLRGWEVDDVNYGIKSCGRQYVLESPDLPREEVLRRLHTLVEATGRKLRSQGKCARGVGVYARMYGVQGMDESNGRWGRKGQYWHQKYLAPLPFYSNDAIWTIAQRLFAHVPPGMVREIGVHCYHLCDGLGDQLTLFGDELAREQQVTRAVDEINDRYGERTIHAAHTLGTSQLVKTKIPFGSTRYL